MHDSLHFDPRSAPPAHWLADVQRLRGPDEDILLPEFNALVAALDDAGIDYDPHAPHHWLADLARNILDEDAFAALPLDGKIDEITDESAEAEVSTETEDSLELEENITSELSSDPIIPEERVIENHLEAETHISHEDTP